MEFVDGGWCSKILGLWGLNFPPQLDLSVPMVWIWRLFSWIYWLYQIPTHIRALEIAWWWRTGAGIMSSWHTWNILMKRAGIGGPLTSRHEIDTVPLKDANSRTLASKYLPVVCAFRLLMSFVGLLQEIGVNLLIVLIFYRALSQIAEGQPYY